MKIEIVQATLGHAESLAPRLRQSDMNEVMASSGSTPLVALTRSVELSGYDSCWTALLDGLPHIMWGAAPLPGSGNNGIVWLLSSEEMYRIPARFLKESATYVSRMLSKFDSLQNYVDARNIKSQQWLLRLGFHKVSVDDEFGFERRPFILFKRDKPCVVQSL